jgi:hypothetical protein
MHAHPFLQLLAQVVEQLLPEGLLRAVLLLNLDSLPR